MAKHWGIALLVSLSCSPLLGLQAKTQSRTTTESPRPNVLLLCIDDLRPVLGCYGGAAKTPHLDRFAESAVTFQRHYVQFPSCGPSRASMFGGVRPDTLQLYGNGGAARVADHPDTQPTMPLFFRNQGYTTLSFGKTYHSKGAGEGFGWSRPPWHPESGWTCYVNFQYKDKQAWRPAFEIYDGPDHLHGDYQTADQAIRAIEENRDRPFFIAAGFYKPHLPFVAPQHYWDLYDDHEIEPIEPRNIPDGAITHGYAFREICSYGFRNGDQQKYFTADSLPSPSQAKDLIHAYYAAVSFNDAQVGRILKRLDELGLSENTAVVVWSDHGFHLGDQTRWAKWTQFESDMRCPLMIRLPGVDQQPRSTDALVEAVDLYPTLADYCQIGLPDHLEGQSLVPLIRGEVDKVKEAAFSQVKGLKENSHLLAYSMRTAQHRYIEWRDTSQNNELVARELYDLGPIGSETTNIADRPTSRSVLDACQELVSSGYRSLGPPVANDPQTRAKPGVDEPAWLAGGDISALPRMESKGAVYSFAGKPGDLINETHRLGWNTYRLRLFVDPTGKNMQVNDLGYTLDLARRVRKAGGETLLCLHYSDTWADPGHQNRPKAWADLNHEQLKQRVEDYSAEVIAAFKARGVLPRIVQVGNEINHGMLWPNGKLWGDDAGGWRQFAELLKAAVRGVRRPLDDEDVMRVMLHSASGGNIEPTRSFLAGLQEHGVQYDMIGLSYYPWWHSSIEDLRTNLKITAEKYGKPIVLVETAYPARGEDWNHGASKHNNIWPMTSDGQDRFTRDVVAAVRSTPHGLGHGVLWWFPESIPVEGLNVWMGGRCALFDPNGEAQPAIKSLSEVVLPPAEGQDRGDSSAYGTPAPQSPHVDRSPPVKLILDTDMSGDCDDAGALALLHALADRGECELLAVVTNRKDLTNASAASVDAINTYYGRPSIPIGTDKKGPTALQRTSPYTIGLRDEFPNDIGPDDGAPDALEIYRKILAAQADDSVTICSVGALSNLAVLCSREPELVRAKVRRLVVMGGEFPNTSRPETNIATHREAAQVVAVQWPGEIVWHGFEIGKVLITGARLKQTTPSNPVRRAYELRPQGGGMSIDRGKASYDQAAALFAVRGAEPQFWEIVTGGRVLVDATGLTTWCADAAANHAYVKIVGDPARLAEVIESLMIAEPKNSAASESR